MSINPFFMVFLGGGIGSVARYSLSLLFQRWDLTFFPFATLLANAISTALLGLVVWKYAPSLSQNAILFLTIGFCGGFSTFSTFSLETFNLIKSNQWALAAGNMVISIAATIFILAILSKTLK